MFKLNFFCTSWLSHLLNLVICEGPTNDHLRKAFQLIYFKGLVLHFHELNAILADHGRFVYDQGLVLCKLTSLWQWKGELHQKVAICMQGIGWRIRGHWQTFCHWKRPFTATTDRGIPSYLLSSICSIIYWVLFWCVTRFICTIHMQLQPKVGSL